MTLATMLTIVELLKTEHQIDCTLEYPGYVDVRITDDYHLAFGAANETWGADAVGREGEPISIELHLNTAIPSSSEDARAIARATAAIVREYSAIQNGAKP